MSTKVDVMPVPLVVRTAPERIFLQIADDAYSATEAFPTEAMDQITWCADSVMDTEVAYVRADLVTELIAAASHVAQFSLHSYGGPRLRDAIENIKV